MLHQDRLTTLSLALNAFITVAISLIVVLYQDRKPDLRARCDLATPNSPASVRCKVTNVGRGDAIDVHLAFSERLLAGVDVAAEPHLGVTLVKSTSPPDPNRNPEYAKLQKAFSIVFPRIAAGDAVSAVVFSKDPDNERAAKQIEKLLQKVREKVRQFRSELQRLDPAGSEMLDVDAYILALTKQQSFFKPLDVYYQRGREPVAFLDDREKAAAAIHDDLAARHDKQLREVLQVQEWYRAPIVRIETAGGSATTTSVLPHLGIYVEVDVPVDLLKTGGTALLPLPVPSSYEGVEHFEGTVSNFYVVTRRPGGGCGPNLDEPCDMGLSVQYESPEGVTRSSEEERKALKSVR